MPLVILLLVVCWAQVAQGRVTPTWVVEPLNVVGQVGLLFSNSGHPEAPIVWMRQPDPYRDQTSTSKPFTASGHTNQLLGTKTHHPLPYLQPLQRCHD